MGAVFSQFFFIPAAPITEKNCPDLKDRVFIVTGGYTGIGLELCQILYKCNATVYIAGRSQAKATNAIAQVQQAPAKSTGYVGFLYLDLSDLSTVKPAVETFVAQQQRLDVLVNNAGVMLKGSNNPKHNDIHNTTNCVGPCLLYKLLLPILTKTAASSPTGSVRVIWAASIAMEVNSPKPGGMELDGTGRPKDIDELSSYGQSKVGNVFLARQYAKTTPRTGIVHAAFNPGNLSSELQRHWSGLDITFMKFLFYPPINGAYTELWAALAPEVTPDRSGAYVYPWGRFGVLPAGIEISLKEPSEGGTGLAAKFVSWCERQTMSYT
ncbi:MAG: hypothetical protein M1822_002466 [Bathelium mastoideum]|nr:MAG: hypothetical protein M1822_002466 [Bathelium mastoideum]